MGKSERSGRHADVNNCLTTPKRGDAFTSRGHGRPLQRKEVFSVIVVMQQHLVVLILSRPAASNNNRNNQLYTEDENTQKK